MKKVLTLSTLFAVLFFALNSGAQMMGQNPDMMKESDRRQQNIPQGQENEQAMMHPNMMGGYGMGPGMMGGFGMGPCMMDGYGMGPGMMGGQGMGAGMMGGRWGLGAQQLSQEEYDKFWNETKDQRKKLHDLRFQYGEMMHNPVTTMGELKKIRQQMYDLQKEIQQKAKK